MAGVSHWQEFLSCYRQHFEVVRADTPSLLDDAYRLRYQVYCVENRYEDPGQQANGRERDVYDDRSVHSLLIHRRSGVAAGTMRVILPGTFTQELPINTVTDSGLQQLLRQLPPSHTAEISRFAVSKAFRRGCTETEDRRLLRYLTIGLFRGALEICREHEIQYICAVMERALIRLLARLGLAFEHVGGLIEHHGARQPCFARVDRLIEGSRAEGTLLWRYASEVTEL